MRVESDCGMDGNELTSLSLVEGVIVFHSFRLLCDV